MNPEFSPGFGVRNAGSRDSEGSISIAMRRSAMATDLAQRERDDVGREGHRLTVEIAARQRFGRIGADQRIVGYAVGFGPQRRRRVAKNIEARRP